MEGDQQRSQFFWTVDSPLEVESREAWAELGQKVAMFSKHSVMMDVRVSRMSQC
jgi:hypothetical protein